MQEKEITLSNLQLLESNEALVMLSQERMPVRVGFALATNLKRIRTLLENYQEYRLEVLKRHAKLDSRDNLETDNSGQVVFDSPEKQVEASQDIKELNDAQVTLKAQIFSLEEIEQTGVNVAPALWASLAWMIESD